MLRKVFGRSANKRQNNLIEINYCRFVGDHEFLASHFVYVQCSYKSKKDGDNNVVIQQTRDNLGYINLVTKDSNSFAWQINGFFEVPIDTKCTFTLMKWDGIEDKTRKELGSFTILPTYISESHMMDYTFELNEFKSTFAPGELAMDINNGNAFEDLRLSISLKRHDINDSRFDIRSARTFYKIDDMNIDYKLNGGYLASLGYLEHLRRPQISINFPDVSDPIATLSATILQGKRLRTHFPVFVTLELPGNYHQKFQSQTLFTTNAPLFDFGVDFDVFSLQSDLTILVWEDNPVSGLNLMGRVVIPLTEISDVIVRRKMNILHIDAEAEVEKKSTSTSTSTGNGNGNSIKSDEDSSSKSTVSVTTTTKKGRNKSVSINADGTWTNYPPYIRIPWYHDEHTIQQYEQSFKDHGESEQQEQDKITEMAKRRDRLLPLDSSYEDNKEKKGSGEAKQPPVILHDQEDAAVMMAWYVVYPPIDPSRFNRFGQYRAANPSLQSVGYGMIKPDSAIGYLKIELALTLNEDLVSMMAHNPFCYHQKTEPVAKEEEAGLSDLIIAAQNLLRIYNLLKHSPIRVAINDIRSWRREPAVCTFAFFCMCYLALCAPMWLIPIWIFVLWILLGWYTGNDITFENTAIFLNEVPQNTTVKGKRMDNQQQLQSNTGASPSSNGNGSNDDDDGIDNKKVIVSEPDINNSNNTPSRNDNNNNNNKNNNNNNNNNGNEDTSTESYRQKWQRMKSSAFRMQLMMNDARSSIEKVNNLLMWSDPMLSSLATLAVGCGVICMSVSLLIFQFRQGFFLFIVAMFTDDVQKFIQQVMQSNIAWIKQYMKGVDPDSEDAMGGFGNDVDIEYMSILWKQRDGTTTGNDDDEISTGNDNNDRGDDLFTSALGAEGIFVSPSFYKSVKFIPSSADTPVRTPRSIWEESPRTRTKTIMTRNTLDTSTSSNNDGTSSKNNGISSKSSTRTGMRLQRTSSRDMLASVESTRTLSRTISDNLSSKNLIPLSTTAANVTISHNTSNNNDENDSGSNNGNTDSNNDDTNTTTSSAFEVLSQATSFSKFMMAISVLWLDMVPDDQDLQHRHICRTAMIDPHKEHLSLPCKLEATNGHTFGDTVFESFFKSGDSILDAANNENSLSILRLRGGGKSLKQLLAMFDHVRDDIKKGKEEMRISATTPFLTARRCYHLCVNVVSFSGLDIEKKSTMGTYLKWAKQKVYVDLGVMPLGSCNYHCRSGGQPRHTQVVVREEFMFRNLKLSTECLVLAISYRAPTTKRSTDSIAGYAVISMRDYFDTWKKEVEKVMKSAFTKTNHLNFPNVVKSYRLLDKNWRPLYGNQTVQLRINLLSKLD